jgi:IS5 family transposase
MDAVNRHEEIFGHVPDAATAGRGYGAKDNENKLKAVGVKKVAIPVKGKKSKARAELEESRWFKRLMRWRAGSESKISLLKRKYRLERSLFRGHSGTATWVRLGNFNPQPDKCGQACIKMRIVATNNQYEIVKEPKIYIQPLGVLLKNHFSGGTT